MQLLQTSRWFRRRRAVGFDRADRAFGAVESNCPSSSKSSRSLQKLHDKNCRPDNYEKQVSFLATEGSVYFVFTNPNFERNVIYLQNRWRSVGNYNSPLFVHRAEVIRSCTRRTSSESHISELAVGTSRTSSPRAFNHGTYKLKRENSNAKFSRIKIAQALTVRNPQVIGARRSDSSEGSTIVTNFIRPVNKKKSRWANRASACMLYSVPSRFWTHRLLSAVRSQHVQTSRWFRRRQLQLVFDRAYEFLQTKLHVQVDRKHLERLQHDFMTKVNGCRHSRWDWLYSVQLKVTDSSIPIFMKILKNSR